MKIQILLGLIVAFVGATDALSCFTCENQPSLASCIQKGEVKQCQANENACETHVRRDGDKELIFKTCKQALACVNNEIQNPRAAFTPVQCNIQGQSSVCRCCCYRDRCGGRTTDCREPALTCDAPEEWSDGAVECGDELPSGGYALRHRCQLICNEGFELEEGARDFITCRVDPNDSTKTRWLPEYPTCVQTPVPKCVEPPQSEIAFVDCVPQRPDGGWNRGDTCRYSCPEGTKLVGEEVSECVPTGEEGTLRFSPGPPCCQALRCYTCENQPSLASCIQKGQVKQCQANENACETHVRRDGDKELIFKTSKQALACVNNEIQNPRAASTPVQCNIQGQSSVCRCCCYRDRCGGRTTDCTEPALTCDTPGRWRLGDVECGNGLPNGGFALRHTCQLKCTDGRLEEGVRDFITCRVDPNDSTKTRWLPPYPTCVPTNPGGCETLPVWENRTLICDQPRPDGKWNEGDTCEFLCPEGNTLVGSNVATCLPIEEGGDILTFTPEPPCCKPICNPKRRADILFVLDHSTSITSARWPLVTRFVSDVIESYDLNYVQFGVVVYDRIIQTDLNIPFDFAKSKSELRQKVEAIPYGGQQSGTYTVAALNYARNSAFTSDFGDRADVPDYVIFVTDGASIDKVNIGNGETTLNLAADLLHGVTDETYAVGVGNYNQAELEIIASRDDFIATTNDFGKLSELLDRVTTVTCMTECT